MEKFFRRMVFTSSLSSIIFVVVGIVLLINPVLTLSLIAKTFGIFLIVMGVVGLIQYVLSKPEKFLQTDLIYVAAAIVLGIIALFNTTIVVSIFPIVIGIWIIFTSIIKIRMSFTVKDAGITYWWAPLIMAILTIICGIVMIFNPFAGAVAMMQIGGLLLMVYGILDLVESFMIIRHID